MRLEKKDEVTCDVLVIGGGGAGLRAAIEARKTGADVLLVSKFRVGYGNNTIISAGTFAAASGWSEPEDNPDVHLRDTVLGGRFINDQSLAAVMAREAGPEIAFLKKCGTRFLKRDGKMVAIHPAGHTYARHARTDGSKGTGFSIPLINTALKIGVRFADRVFVTRLLRSKKGPVAAATGLTRDGKLVLYKGRSIVLATGGYAQVYCQTNNAPGITGDGHALAYDLGLTLRDMEFVQFYPTAAGGRGNRIVLYEDLILDDRAVLTNARGEDVIARHGLDQLMNMTRDRLSQAIMREILEGRDVEGGVVMDLSRASEQAFKKYGSLTGNPHEKAFIVSPTTHFCSGGVIISENAETRIPGLFAAGEICGGVHGANRIAGNALSEAFAMGGVAGKKAAVYAKEMDRVEPVEDEAAAEQARIEALGAGGEDDLRGLRRLLKEVMWYQAGIMRNGKDLEGALTKIEAFKARLPRVRINSYRDIIETLETVNMLRSAEMVCRSALLRTESRGGHYRSDYPEEDNGRWLKFIAIEKKESGMDLKTVPVTMKMIRPED